LLARHPIKIMVRVTSITDLRPQVRITPKMVEMTKSMVMHQVPEKVSKSCLAGTQGELEG
jgi:hypothetical protein